MLLVLIFFGAILLRVFIYVEEISSLQAAITLTSFSSLEQIVWVLIIATVAATLLMVVVVCIEAQRVHLDRLATMKWSCATMQPPSFNWRTTKVYACFLSHYKMEAASDCRYLHDVLAKMLRAPIYLDSSTLSDLRTLFSEVTHPILVHSFSLVSRRSWSPASTCCPICLVVVTG